MGRFLLLDGAQIQLYANYSDGCILTIHAEEEIRVAGNTSDSDGYFPSNIFMRSFLNDNLGGIYLNTNTLTLTEGGRIDTLSYLSGNGGDIHVKADQVRISGGTYFQDEVFPEPGMLSPPPG